MAGDTRPIACVLTELPPGIRAAPRSSRPSRNSSHQMPPTATKNPKRAPNRNCIAGNFPRRTLINCLRRAVRFPKAGVKFGATSHSPKYHNNPQTKLTVSMTPIRAPKSKQDKLPSIARPRQGSLTQDTP